MRTRGKLAGLVALAAGTWYVRDYVARRAARTEQSRRELEALAALSDDPGPAPGRDSLASTPPDGDRPAVPTPPDPRVAEMVRGVLATGAAEGPVVAMGPAAQELVAAVGVTTVVGLDGLPARNGNVPRLARAAVAAGGLERTVDTYGELSALSQALLPGAPALVLVPNAAEAPARPPFLDPLGWLEALAGNRRAEALSLFRMVSADGTSPDIHFAPADLRRLVVDAGFDVVSETGRLGPTLAFTLRKAREPRPRPRRPWWPQHAVDRLPLDYMTTREEVLALVPPASANVLDVGCAAGALGLALRERGARVTGIEVDPPLAALAAEVLDHVAVGDAAELLRDAGALDGEPYDCVIFADCLEHLVDPWSTLRDAVRRLDPGGVVVVSLPNIRHWDTFWQVGVRGTWPRRDSGLHDATHLRQFTRRDAVALLAGAGLNVEAVVPVHRVLESRPTALDRVAAALPGAAGELVTFQWLLVGRKPAAAEAARAS